MTHTLERGTTIYGFAGGLFGRDSYDDKTVIESGIWRGIPWAILEVHTYGKPRLAFLWGQEDVNHAAEYTTEPEPDIYD